MVGTFDKCFIVYNLLFAKFLFQKNIKTYKIDRTSYWMAKVSIVKENNNETDIFLVCLFS